MEKCDRKSEEKMLSEAFRYTIIYDVRKRCRGFRLATAVQKSTGLAHAFFASERFTRNWSP
jgi:hypothetical protein